MKNNHFRKNIAILVLFISVLFSYKMYAQKSVPETMNTEVLKAEWMWDAKVKIDNMITLGNSKYGTRRVIPILGGSFSGKNIKGEVLPAGEDWQIVREDGDTELTARYLLKTDDGYLIQVINKAIIHLYKEKNKPPYIRSVIDLEAPTNSPYDDLNHAIFLGTLKIPELKKDEEPYVIIGVYKLL